MPCRRYLIGTECFKDQRAVAAVEFALVLPFFIALVFGIIIFGSYLAVVHGVQQLAAEAARSSVAGLTDSERASLAQSYVTASGLLPVNLSEPAFSQYRGASGRSERVRRNGNV